LLAWVIGIGNRGAKEAGAPPPQLLLSLHRNLMIYIVPHLPVLNNFLHLIIIIIIIINLCQDDVS